VFRVAKIKERTLQLVFERCISGESACARLGKGTTARLEERPDGFATLEGVDVAALLSGRQGQARVELVGFPIYWARVDKLQKQFVPGGKCEALRSYTMVGGKPCLGGPAAVAPSR
jgi:hypothetical protein